MMNTFLIKPATRTLSVDEYYFSTKLAEIRRMNKNGENVINLGIGNPDLAPSKSAINELLKAAVEPLNHGYQSYNGILELREAFSVWYKKYYDVELDPSSEILPLMGSKEGVFHISLAFLNRGDKVLIPDPGYPVYKTVASLCEAEAVVYDLKEENNWYPDFDSLEKNSIDLYSSFKSIYLQDRDNKVNNSNDNQDDWGNLDN